MDELDTMLTATQKAARAFGANPTDVQAKHLLKLMVNLSALGARSILETRDEKAAVEVAKYFATHGLPDVLNTGSLDELSPQDRHRFDELCKERDDVFGAILDALSIENVWRLLDFVAHRGPEWAALAPEKGLAPMLLDALMQSQPELLGPRQEN